MVKLPRVNAAQVLRALARDGWYESRQSGSHKILRHATKPGIVVVAYHVGDILRPKTLQSIIEDAGLTVEQFGRLL